MLIHATYSFVIIVASHSFFMRLTVNFPMVFSWICRIKWINLYAGLVNDTFFIFYAITFGLAWFCSWFTSCIPNLEVFWTFKTGILESSIKSNWILSSDFIKWMKRTILSNETEMKRKKTIVITVRSKVQLHFRLK